MFLRPKKKYSDLLKPFQGSKGAFTFNADGAAYFTITDEDANAILEDVGDDYVLISQFDSSPTLKVICPLTAFFIRYGAYA